MLFETNEQQAQKVQALCDALLGLSPGETITYRELARAIGSGRVTSQTYELRRALKLAEETSGALFNNVQGEGYQRLPAHEILGIGKRGLARGRGQFRRTRKRLETVRANDLTPQVNFGRNAYVSHFGVLESLAKEGVTKKIANAMEEGRALTVRAVSKGLAALMAGQK